MVTFFPTLVNMVRGLKAVETAALELMHVLDANWWQTLRKLRFPSSTPYFFAAMRVAVPSSILGATVAEWLGASSGLGYLIVIATFEFRSDLLYATMVVAATASILAFLGVSFLGKKMVPWWEAERQI